MHIHVKAYKLQNRRNKNEHICVYTYTPINRRKKRVKKSVVESETTNVVCVWICKRKNLHIVIVSLYRLRHSLGSYQKHEMLVSLSMYKLYALL